ncbi:hypothetical protein L3X38_031749 [Prunus dulcis]|uniref:Uncharacterized protein n=1 Tax=Prunus dulcis TaxID=3755 RepID=A0AAD4VE84_PRUDU|nr:hypothetical protein L3X38_031749 [Prunus dulcis]
MAARLGKMGSAKFMGLAGCVAWVPGEGWVLDVGAQRLRESELQQVQLLSPPLCSSSWRERPSVSVARNPSSFKVFCSALSLEV